MKNVSKINTCKMIPVTVNKKWLLFMAFLCTTISMAHAEVRIIHTTAHLSQARSGFAGAAIGNRVFFGGGYAASSYSNVVDVYDTSTGTWYSSLRGEVMPLSQARASLSAESANGRIFFAGGYPGGGARPSSVVDVFDESGTRIAITAIQRTAASGRGEMGSAVADGKIYFAGGEANAGADWQEITVNYVDEFNAITLDHRVMNLSIARGRLMGTSIGHKVFFAGGEYCPMGGNFFTSVSRIDIYDTQLDSWSTAELSVARANGAAATISNESIFAGGLWKEANGQTWHASAVVDIFNAQSNEWRTANISEARAGLAGIGLGDLAFFAGGYTGSVYSDVVDIYNKVTGQWSVLHLSEPRRMLAVITIGNQIFFAGGNNENGESDTVDIFTIVPSNDEKADAISVEINDVIIDSTLWATGTDITHNGYNDCNDVWYYFEPATKGNYTIQLYNSTFDTTLAIFDQQDREVMFNDDFFGEKSLVILKAKANKRYYIRVAGYDGEVGDFTMSVQQGSVQAFQGDLNYDGNVNLDDFAAFAENWMIGG